MSFKLSKKRNGVVTVDSSEAGGYDWVVVVFDNGDVLRFHSLPPSLIRDASNERYAPSYLANSSPQKPALWVDWIYGNPPYCVKSLVDDYQVHRSDLGIALDSDLIIGQRPTLNVMTWRHAAGYPPFHSLARVGLNATIRDVFAATVPLEGRKLVPFYVAS